MGLVGMCGMCKKEFEVKKETWTIERSSGGVINLGLNRIDEEYNIYEIEIGDIQDLKELEDALKSMPNLRGLIISFEDKHIEIYDDYRE